MSVRPDAVAGLESRLAAQIGGRIMTKRSNILVLALMSAGLAGCAGYAGGPQAWSGNPKFTVGLNAPTAIGVDAAARERTAAAPR